MIQVDGKKIEVEELFSNPREIMVLAGKDPDQYFLNQFRGDTEIGYKNDPEHKIRVHNNQIFKSYRLEKGIVIIVNGTPHKTDKDNLSYEEVVTLAFPDYPQHPERTYSVTYSRGTGNKPEGILAPGGNVNIKK